MYEPGTIQGTEEYNKLSPSIRDTFILIERKPINVQANTQTRKMPVDDVLVMKRYWSTIILFFVIIWLP